MNHIDDFRQVITGPVQDGEAFYPESLEALVRAGYVDKVNGWNILTTNGAIVAINLGLMKK